MLHWSVASGLHFVCSTVLNLIALQAQFIVYTSFCNRLIFVAGGWPVIDDLRRELDRTQIAVGDREQESRGLREQIDEAKKTEEKFRR